jgi:hypothetical protein
MGKREEVERCLLVYHDDGQGAQAWRQHQKNGRRRPPPLKEEDGEGSFPRIHFHSKDTCSIGRCGPTGLAG